MLFNELQVTSGLAVGLQERVMGHLLVRSTDNKLGV